MKRNVKYSRASSKTKNKKLFKKFKKDPSKQYIKKIRIYPAFLYKYQDKWFKSMSLKGWHIVDCRMSIYLFEKGEPEEKEYFSFGIAAKEKKYWLFPQDPFIEKKYGLKNSKLNSSRLMGCHIIEIDLNKVDTEKDEGYKKLISERDRLYKRYYLKYFFVYLIAVLSLVLCYVFLR